MSNQHGRFQARPRMRVPYFMHPSIHQNHVIRAICRNPEIDKEDLYGQALAGLRHGNNAKAFSTIREAVSKVTAGALLDDKGDAPVRGPLIIDIRNVDEQTSSKIREFNSKFLNDRGESALLTLLTFDVGDLDPVAIDAFRGGEALSAAYGPRRTRRDKKQGKQIQSLLKGFKSVDEPATMEAADRYVEYRYLDNGSLPDYKKRKELGGDTYDESYYRDWFRKFDDAFGFPRPRPGPPSNKSNRR